jgi:hypothetical protein
MIMNLISLKSTSVLIAMGLSLAACGGGGGSSSPADPLVAGTDIPVSATETMAGVVSFANLTLVGKDESSDPLVIGDAALASSETEEPDPSV